MTETNLKQWIENYDNGKYNDASTATQCEAGWFDWFCKDTSLANKTKRLAPKVKQIAKSTMIDPEKTYVFFKNNCPVCGTLFDSFSICDIESGDVLYWVAPRTGYEGREQAEVYGEENNFHTPLAHGTWKDIKNFFGVK